MAKCVIIYRVAVIAVEEGFRCAGMGEERRLQFKAKVVILKKSRVDKH
jgi:hypothetical protein